MSQTTLTFSGRDYSAEFERLFALLKSELPQWTDWNHSDAGVVLLRLLARETDQLNHYIDRVFAEGFLSTARFKQSLIDLGMLVGYLPTLASPAATTLRLALQDGDNGPVTIPQYSAFQRADGISYLTTEAVLLAEGLSADVTAIQGTLVETDFEPSDFTVSDWTKRPRVSLGKAVAAGSCLVRHGEPSVVWTEVESFWRSWPEDYDFLLELSEDDTVWLVLGDGAQGSGFPGSETLNVSFIRTDEAAGNGGHSTIYLVPDGFTDLITCTNIDPCTGGAAAESIDSLRRMIPRVTRTQRRGVTTEDYEALIEHMPGVLHVQAVDRNSMPSALGEALWGATWNYGWPHMYVVLVVVPEGGGPMSTLLKQQIWAQCASWGHLGNWRERYILVDAITWPVNVAMRIGVLPGYQPPDAVRSAVITAISALLTIENQTIGGVLRFADLHAAASTVAGVSWVEFDSPFGDTKAPDGHIITAGTVTATVS